MNVSNVLLAVTLLWMVVSFVTGNLLTAGVMALTAGCNLYSRYNLSEAKRLNGSVTRELLK